jgi:3,4-dihydroxy 2-butanone 4-phosphate synthase/GTP cyclohydrolase II
VDILQDLGISRVRLLTNNPEKLEALENSPVEVVGREPLIISPKEENEAYLETKKKLMGHLF